MGIPLLRGRLESDADFNVDARYALVNQTAARRWWPDGDPIGKVVTPYAKKDLHYTVVGVVGDVRDVSLDAPAEATVYLLGRSWPAMTFLMHTSGPPMALAGVVRDRVRAVGPTIPFRSRRSSRRCRRRSRSSASPARCWRSSRGSR